MGQVLSRASKNGGGRIADLIADYITIPHRADCVANYDNYGNPRP